ncbi:condensation domain-containing protein [Frankia sp. Mgl5]|nr:condensation domain-containing protein [Frankia sp. Mgl5]
MSVQVDVERQGGSLGPVPDRFLTSSEQILAASDRPDAPLTCGFLVQFEGKLDAARLRHAMREVSRRHRMMRAALYGARQYAWRFGTEPPAGSVGLVEDGSSGWDVHEKMVSGRFDLHAHPPLRIALVRGPDGDQLSLVAHHLAVDGMGLTAILSDIIAEYRLTEVATVTDGPVETHVGLPAGVPPAAKAAVAGWTAFARRSGRHITPMGTGRDTGYGYQPLTLPVPGRVLLGSGRRITVNDLLMAATHLTIDRWNRQRGGESGTLRIRMPISLGNAAEVGGNNTGQALVVTEPTDRADLARLAARVVDQTEHAKQAAAAPPIAGVAGKVGMTAAELIPGPWRVPLLRWGVRAARPLITPAAAVSNIGSLSSLASDEPKISSVYFTATVGMPQGLLICVAGYGNNIHVTFGYHRHLFGREAASAFANLFRTAFGELTRIGSAM